VRFLVMNWPAEDLTLAKERGCLSAFVNVLSEGKSPQVLGEHFIL